MKRMLVRLVDHHGDAEPIEQAEKMSVACSSGNWLEIRLTARWFAFYYEVSDVISDGWRVLLSNGKPTAMIPECDYAKLTHIPTGARR